MLREEIELVKVLSRIIAKEEIAAMGKALEAEIKDVERIVKGLEERIMNLKTDMEDLKAEIKRAKEVKPKR